MTSGRDGIVADTKDWTWVLIRECPECGFDTRTVDRDEVGPMLRANAAAWVAILARDDVATRSRPDRWSPLEYACHVRDVFRVFDERLALMLAHDSPTFPNWDQDATAVAQRYGEQVPAVVSEDLVRAAETVAAAFEAVPDDAWTRTGTRSDGSVFTVETMARYFVHDPEHHVYDVTGATVWTAH
jgi:hypothetical protein